VLVSPSPGARTASLLRCDMRRALYGHQTKTSLASGTHADETSVADRCTSAASAVAAASRSMAGAMVPSQRRTGASIRRLSAPIPSDWSGGGWRGREGRVPRRRLACAENGTAQLDHRDERATCALVSDWGPLPIGADLDGARAVEVVTRRGMHPVPVADNRNPLSARDAGFKDLDLCIPISLHV
jgi:hypothetical protein